jgi:hypothetical protein
MGVSSIIASAGAGQSPAGAGQSTMQSMIMDETTTGSAPSVAASAVAPLSDLQLYGTPGTLPSFVLRCFQLIAAVLAIVETVTLDKFYWVPAFKYVCH